MTDGVGVGQAGGAVPQWRLADRLRRAREHAGLDQQQLADRAGLSRASVSALERGHRRPMPATIRVWSLATGVSLAWLEHGDRPPAPATWWGSPALVAV